MSHCLKTGSAMMRLTILTATLMKESAALTSTQITVLIVHVIIRKIVPLGLLPLLLGTGFAMMRQTMLTVIMMVEIVVDLAF